MSQTLKDTQTLIGQVTRQLKDRRHVILHLLKANLYLEKQEA